MCGKAAVAREGLELRSVDPVRGQVIQQRATGEEPVGMEVQRDPQVAVNGRALSQRVDVMQRSCHRSAGGIQSFTIRV